MNIQYFPPPNNVGVFPPPLPNIPPVNGDLARAKDYIDSLDWTRKRECRSYLVSAFY